MLFRILVSSLNMTGGWSFLKTLLKSNQENVKSKSLEEGKSDFLQIVSSFKSEDDAILFLNWIKNEALEKLFSNLDLAGIKNGGSQILATNNFQIENHDVVEPKSFSVLLPKLKQEILIQTETEKDTGDDSDDFEFEPDIVEVDFSDEKIRNGIKKKQNQPKIIYGNQFRYKCEECDKSFITPSKLERHSFTHSGLQPYQCHLCQRTYNQPGNLKVHIKSHWVTSWLLPWAY